MRGQVLLLGGTAEARALADLLVGDGLPVVSSLAGRVSRPRLPRGEVRVGGFGGVEGLRAYLRDHGVAAVVDATHPYARRMSAHAAAACTGVPLLRLARPGWTGPATACWHRVPDHDAAARVAADLGRRPVLTVGRQPLPHYAPVLGGHPALVRVVEPPDDVPRAWTIVRDRGPYALGSEERLLRGHGADVLVTKDSGGAYTWPKLEAAAGLGVPVVVVDRPEPPVGVACVDGVPAARAWVHHVLTPAGSAR
ncbi:cobalt-precorrin-6A reductase [Thalassiella azotivora]